MLTHSHWLAAAAVRQALFRCIDTAICVCTALTPDTDRVWMPPHRFLVFAAAKRVEVEAAARILRRLHVLEQSAIAFAPDRLACIVEQ